MKKLLITSILIVIFVPIQTITGQEQFTLSSYNQARALVEKSLSKMGFGVNQPPIQNIVATFDGEVFQRHQGVIPLPPYRSIKAQAKLLYEIGKSRLSLEDTFKAPDGFGQHLRRIRMAKGGFNLDFWAKTSQNFPNSSIEEFRIILDRIPLLVLQRVLESPNTLRLGGETDFRNKKHFIVYGFSGNTPVTLYFDKQTSLLSKYDFLMTDVFEGDVVQERVFEDYQQKGAIIFPKVFQRWIAGTLSQDYKIVNFEVNQPIDEALFDKSSEFKEISVNPNTTANSKTTISPISPGVFLLDNFGTGNFQMLIVEFDNYLLVAEPVNNSGVCEQAIDLIKKQFPNKPIRYIVPTHHHEEHAGGLRAFIAEGATVITTPKNKPFFEAMSRAKQTMQLDRLAKNPRPANIEIIANKKRVFTDGKQTVEIYDIGQNLHTEEMIIIYLPQSGIVFQGDIYNELGQGKELLLYFADWLKNSKLKVNQILGVHLSAKTIQEFEIVVEKLKGEATK